MSRQGNDNENNNDYTMIILKIMIQYNATIMNIVYFHYNHGICENKYFVYSHCSQVLSFVSIVIMIMTIVMNTFCGKMVILKIMNQYNDPIMNTVWHYIAITLTIKRWLCFMFSDCMNIITLKMSTFKMELQHMHMQ